MTSARTVGPAGGVHKGDAVTAYQWMINEDSTGDPGTAAAPLFDRCLPSRAPGGSTKPASPAAGDPTEPYADSCPWPSVRPTSGHSKIVAQGDQNDLGASHVLDGLAPGKYLVSVTADGYKIDGAHFVVTPGLEGLVSVGMQPLPLPLATIKIQVFNDNVPARRHLRGRRRAGPGRLHRQPLRRPRSGEHRLLRQRPVHGLPPRRTDRTDDVRGRRQARRRHDALDRQVHE